MPPTVRKAPPRMKGIVTPPWDLPKEKSRVNRVSRSREPLLIRMFSWYLVIRASLFLIAALFLFGAADNPLSVFLIGHATLFTRRLPISAPGQDAAAAIQSYLAGYCIFFGLLYGLTAWRWIARNWISRWGLMFITGATAIKSMLAVAVPDASLYIFGSVPIGNPIPLSQLQLSFLVISACFNLAICFYLMFYPGVEETFERPFQ